MKQNICQRGFLGRVYNIRRRGPGLRHPHVQWPIRHKGKAALGLVDLHGADTDIQHDTVKWRLDQIGHVAKGAFDQVQPVAKFTSILGAAAGPCALIAIGLFLVDKPITEGSFEVGLMTFSKLILHPLLTGFALLVLFPTEPLWAYVGILLAALPIGSGPFVLAQAQGVYPRRTSTAMLVTTVVSIVTVSAFFLVFPAAP